MKAMNLSRPSVANIEPSSQALDSKSSQQLEPLRGIVAQMQAVCKASHGDHRTVQLPDSVCEILFGMLRRGVIDAWHYRFFTDSYTDCTYEHNVRLAEKVVEFLSCCDKYRIDRSSIEGARVCSMFESLLNSAQFAGNSEISSDSMRLVHFSEVESDIRDSLPSQSAFDTMKGIYEEVYAIVLKMQSAATR